MNKNITYEDICSVGMELFRKNNDTFMRSNLSNVMKRIFKAANKEFNLTDYDDVYYMKSGKLPDRVYYIYSKELEEKAPEKVYDVVNFKGELCIWFYSANLINLIGKNPVYSIYSLYNILLDVFTNFKPCTAFASEEEYIVGITMNIVLAKFICQTYKVLDMKEYKSKLYDFLEDYTDESSTAFINDVIENCDSNTFFSSREYLDSYMLLEKKSLDTDTLLE